MAKTVKKARHKAGLPVKVKVGKVGKVGPPAKGRAGDASTSPMTPASIKVTIEALGDGAYPVFVELDDLFRKEEQSKLSFWWNIGKKFLAIQQTWQEDGLADFCMCLGKDPREVRLAMRAASLWNEDEIRDIAERARKHNGSVTWSHVRVLLSMDDKDRDRYLKMIEQEKIGYEVLAARAKAENPELGKKKKGGRKFDIPNTYLGIYHASTRQTAVFGRFASQMGEKLRPAIAKIPSERFSDELLTRTRQMRQQCEEVAKVIAERVEELVAFERQIEQKLDLHPDDDVAASATPPTVNGAAMASPPTNGAIVDAPSKPAITRRLPRRPARNKG